jgi:hypothetical protein
MLASPPVNLPTTFSGDAVRHHLLDFIHDRSGMQQRLGWDAADVEADATEGRIALYQHRAHAEIGRAECGRVAAGPRSEHQHVAFNVGCPVVASRRWHRHRWGLQLLTGGRGGRRRGGDPCRECEDEASLANLVADLDLHLLDCPGRRRRYLHRCFVGFEGDQWILGFDLVSTFHRHLDDRHVLEVADVGDTHLDHFVDARGCAVIGDRRPFAGGMAFLLHLLARCGTGGCHIGFRDKEQRAFGNLVSDFDLELLHHSVDRRRHVHGGFVGFERDQRVFDLDSVARANQHLDDRHVLEGADIGHLDVD